MLLNKEILTGLYGGGKTNINFNISWRTDNVTITAYDPQVNENDRPRINTWRSDDSYINYLSAGFQVFDFTTSTFSTPWGDRSVGSETITIPVRTSDTAGVDLFTDSSLPTPYLVPDISQWTVTDTGNPNEKKYQYSINRTANRQQNISIELFESGLWAFRYTANTNLNNFSVRTIGSGNTLLNTLTAFWELNETSGTRIDSHSTYNLTQAGTVGSTTGKIGNAATFNGLAGNWLGSGHTFDLAPNGFTVSTWISGSPLNIGPAVSQWNFGAGMFIGISNAEWGTNTPGNYINFVLGDIPDENTYNYYSASFPNPGGWNHVVGVYDPATTSVKLYVNGVLRDSTTGVPANVALDGTANFKIGTIDEGNEFAYNGAVDSTGLWLRPLTETEITSLYNSGNGLTYNNFGNSASNNTTIFWGDNSSDVVASGVLTSHSYTV